MLLSQKRSTEDKNLTVVALDCEMVETYTENNCLVQVVIVGQDYEVLLNKKCKPKDKVFDYRESITGFKEGDFDDAISFEQLRQETIEMLKNKIVTGHHLENDFKALRYRVIKNRQRDTAVLPMFKSKDRIKSLRKLAKEFLNKDIQNEVHCPIEDARTSMELYNKYKEAIEEQKFDNLTSKEKIQQKKIDDKLKLLFG